MRIVKSVINYGDDHYRSFAKNYHCYLDHEQSCPFLAKNQCIHIRPANVAGCIFGFTSLDYGYTKRAKKYADKIEEWENIESLDVAPVEYRHIEAIGPWVWFGAYKYMELYIAEYVTTGRRTVNVLGQADVRQWLLLESFSPDICVALAHFHPCFFGSTREITEYQVYYIPKFLYNLKTHMPHIWESCLELDPSLETRLPRVADVREKTVNIWDLPCGSNITIPYFDGVTGVSWCGVLRITGNKQLLPQGAYEKLPDQEYVLSFKPPRGFQVRVNDDDLLGKLLEKGLVRV